VMPGDRAKERRREQRAGTSGQEASHRGDDESRRATRHTRHRESDPQPSHPATSPYRSEQPKIYRRASSREPYAEDTLRATSRERDHRSSRHKDGRLRRSGPMETLPPKYDTTRRSSNHPQSQSRDSNTWYGQAPPVQRQRHIAGHEGVINQTRTRAIDRPETSHLPNTSTQDAGAFYNMMATEVRPPEEHGLRPDDSVSAVADQAARSAGWLMGAEPFCPPGWRAVKYKGAWWSVSNSATTEQFFRERMNFEREEERSTNQPGVWQG
jgi:hypothetical protein